MNIPFLLAGILSLIAALAHGLGGETTLLRKMSTEVFPTMPNGDGAQAKAETRMTWHAVTVYFALTGILLLLMAFNQFDDIDALAGVITLHFISWAFVLALVPPISVSSWRAIYRSPQWVLLLMMAALSYGGTL